MRFIDKDSTYLVNVALLISHVSASLPVSVVIKRDNDSFWHESVICSFSYHFD